MRYFIILLFFLCGCSSFIETVKNPSDLWRFDTLKLKLEAPNSLNVDRNNLSRSTMFRIYQLKYKKNLELFGYEDWLNFDKTNKIVLNMKQYTLKPNEQLEIKEDLLRETECVAIVFFFSQQDQEKEQWRKILTIDELEDYGVLKLSVNDKSIMIVDQKK